MKKFIYTSITTCYLSLKLANTDKDFCLLQNGIYELPDQNPKIKILIAQGKLLLQVPIETTTAELPKKNTINKHKK